MRRRWSVGLALAAFVGLMTCAVLPCPYVIESPGPVFNALGQVKGGNGAETDVLTVDGATTYPTSGQLDVLTVSVVGTPDQQPVWLDVVSSWFGPHTAVTPMEAVYQPGTTTEQTNTENRQQMSQSQQDAVAAALRQLGYVVPSSARVNGFSAGSQSADVLRTDDRILQVDGVAAESNEQLRAAAEAHGTAGQTVPLLIERDGVQQSVQVPPFDADGTWLLGVALSWEYDFPVQVTINLGDVGGPSAGLVLSLATVERLTPGSLTGGQSIAGTGTMTGAGQVGAIGGVRQKMAAARSNGAEWFLVPSANCPEVVGDIPSGLQVLSVDTLQEATNDLNAIAASKSAEGLKTCQ